MHTVVKTLKLTTLSTSCFCLTNLVIRLTIISVSFFLCFFFRFCSLLLKYSYINQLILMCCISWWRLLWTQSIHSNKTNEIYVCYLNYFYHFSRRSKIKQTRFSVFYRFFSCQYLVYFGNKLLNYMFSWRKNIFRHFAHETRSKQLYTAPVNIPVLFAKSSRTLPYLIDWNACVNCSTKVREHSSERYGFWKP